MKATKFNIDLISLENISILNAAINNTAGIVALDNNKHFFDIQYQINPAVNLQIKKARLTFTCNIQTFKGENDPIDISASFQIAFIFNVENLGELVKGTEDGVIDIDTDLMGSLFNITYSTSRGIIYTRCLGTILSDLILPIVSTSALLQDAGESKK